MFKRKKLSTAIKIAAGLAVVAVPIQGAYAEDDMLEEIVVTGSRIARTNFDSAAQLVSMDRMQIDAQGSLGIADVLRQSPVNTFGSFSERSGNSWQSQSTLDLRGLGASRTLTMINGRRMVGSPNMGAQIINLNMIPMSAIDRIDILADGGSAVYGSDAVAGVVNMVMRKDFEGLEIGLRSGQRDKDDGTEEAVNILLGMNGDRGNITLAVEFNKRDAIFDKDREYTAPWIRETDGNAVTSTYIDTDGISFYGKSVELWDATTGFYDFQAAVGCPTTGGFKGVMDASAVIGGPADNTYTLCSFAYGEVSANKASLDRINMFVSGHYEISDSIEFFSDVLFSKVESFGRYAPPAAGWPNMPSDYVDVPWDIDALVADGTISADYELSGYYRWTNIGNRDNIIQDTQYDVVLGFRGDAGDNVSFEVYAQHSRYDAKENSYYYLSYTGLDYVLAEGIDPFSEEGAAMMRANPIQDNFTQMDKYYGQVQFGAGDWTGGGDTIVLLGAEYFEVDYNNQYDSQSEAGLIGGSAGTSSGGYRDMSALFGEMVVPVTDSIEVNAAFRYDDYSDFGTATSPSISARWQIMDNLSVRSRWSQGFKAPSLADLYGPSAFSAESVRDYTKCAASGTDPADCNTRQIDTWFSTNPKVGAETSDTFSMGANWEYIPGFSVDLAYWMIEISDVISTPSPQGILNAEFAGIVMALGSDVYVDRTTPVTKIYSTSTNAGELNVEGIDLQLTGVLDTGFGAFSFSGLFVHTLSYETSTYYSGPAQETAGFNLQPEWKMQGAFVWTYGNHQLDYVIDYIDGSAETDTITVSAGGAIKLVASSAELDSWTTMNLSYAYDFGDYGRIKIGARNLTNEDPVLDSTGKFGEGHPEMYDQTGRVVYGEYKIVF